ncbi:NlpC/P60 family protein [Actinomadura sp. 1N219]|uniref:NlpC/P60 family protein n=1 Tax=Actinomadura sp. 1N219 TaxID=3375152 RepID=UPI0037872BEB
MLRTAVTLTVTGLALAVPTGSQALAALNPAVLKRLHLDSATLKKVQAYDRYRTREASQREGASKALAFARKQIGKPYRWGAEGPGGYDCSGLAMASWRKAGVKLPRVTHAQYRQVKRKVSLKDLKPGDLVFFRGRNHVGLYVGSGRYLHAPYTGARVRIDKLDARRKRQFAGAVRPGAPAYKKWSTSVKELVEKIDRMSADKRTAHKPPDKQRTPQIPPPSDTLPKSPDSLPDHSPDHDLAEADAPPGRPRAAKPDDSAARPPRGDERPEESRPEPRPRYKAKPASRSPRHARHDSDSWEKYVGTVDELTAPGHVPH